MTTTAKVPRKSGLTSGPKRPRTSASLEVGTALVQRSLPPIEGLVIGGEPRVHLLPPQVLITRRGKVIRRRLGFGVIAVIVLVAAAFGAASLALANSQANLLTANNQTNTILQEQLKYGDVLKVKSDAAAIQSSQKVATAQEILWSPFYASFEGTMPAGSSITSLSVSLDDPLGTTQLTTPTLGPVQGAHIATVQGTLTMPQGAISGWLDSLGSLKGFVDVTPNSVTATAGGIYTVTITMHINSDVLANRFIKSTGGNK
jgi:hypothetical protein